MIVSRAKTRLWICRKLDFSQFVHLWCSSFGANNIPFSESVASEALFTDNKPRKGQNVTRNMSRKEELLNIKIDRDIQDGNS